MDNANSQRTSNYYNKLDFTSKHIIKDNVLYSNTIKKKLDRKWFYMKDLKTGNFYKNNKLLCSSYWLSQMDYAISKIYEKNIDKYIVSVGYNAEFKDCQIGFSGTGEDNETRKMCFKRNGRRNRFIPKHNKYLKEIHKAKRNRLVSYYTIDIKDLKANKNINI